LQSDIFPAWATDLPLKQKQPFWETRKPPLLLAVGCTVVAVIAGMVGWDFRYELGRQRPRPQVINNVYLPGIHP
jgi:hypothetical protein